jgi:hypothetical protein
LEIVNTNQLEHELALFVGSSRGRGMLAHARKTPLLYMGREVYQPGVYGPLLNAMLLGVLKELNARGTKVRWRKKPGPTPGHKGGSRSSPL